MSTEFTSLDVLIHYGKTVSIKWYKNNYTSLEAALAMGVFCSSHFYEQMGKEGATVTAEVTNSSYQRQIARQLHNWDKENIFDLGFFVRLLLNVNELLQAAIGRTSENSGPSGIKVCIILLFYKALTSWGGGWDKK